MTASLVKRINEPAQAGSSIAPNRFFKPTEWATDLALK